MSKVKGKHELLEKKPRRKCTFGLQVGTWFTCADNTGAKIMKIIGVKGVGGRLNRLPAGSPGDVVMASVKKGKPDLKKKIVMAVIIRQKKEIRRRDGSRVCFEDNAGVIITNKGELKGTQVAGPVPREVCDMWPKISSQASSII
ncbi:ribosomal protein L23 [Hamiltosporidium tvaerminnensis]|uniref:Large ribosomal subunit protein uL14 n=2 Tax=Hamiltosporidium TaxID=1176354 RepID=A0A4Q9L0R5_9MICR|nr:ribosomal protein L23 [Hamiltosporidium tvaerminnensis]TBT99411.1 ribosomal protein L23 [Hamiltosporidium magnivora]TBU00924.1 ribosomal protein L23 [Hamiltosporidium magnivora]TBU09751.1 ribosomal protein L23 [Hamiltosporidium tvaerminnensis]TBU11589.1 ribosomal protein L23 [Hamiltosporidium tvaerminnensis]